MAVQLDSSMSTGFPFLKLPPELRNMVYDQITSKTQRKTVKATLNRDLVSGHIHSYAITSIRTTLPVAILATCRQIYNELKPQFERVMKMLELDPVRLVTAYEGIVTSPIMKPKEAVAMLLDPCRSFLEHNRSREDPPLQISIPSLGNITAQAYTSWFLKAVVSKMAETGARAEVFARSPRGARSLVRCWVTFLLLDEHMKIQAGDAIARELHEMVTFKEIEDNERWAELWKLVTRI